MDCNSVASSPEAAAAALIDPEPGPVYIRPKLISGGNTPKSMAKFLTRSPVTTPTVIASGTSAQGLSRSHAAHARPRGNGTLPAAPQLCPLVIVALCNNCSQLPYLGSGTYGAPGRWCAGLISSTQFRTLVILSNRGPVNLATLAGLLDVQPSTTGRMVDRLVSAGLIDRGPHPSSRRELVAELTAHASSTVF